MHITRVTARRIVASGTLIAVSQKTVSFIVMVVETSNIRQMNEVRVDTHEVDTATTSTIGILRCSTLS